MSYSHFTIEERASIKHLLENGVSIRRIAKALDRSPSSVSREIKRNHLNRTLYGGTNYSVVLPTGSIKNEYQKRIISSSFLWK